MNVGELLTNLANGSTQDQLILALIKVVLVVGAVLTLVPTLIWFERRLLSWMQDRIGPNRGSMFTLRDNFPIKGLRGKRFRLLWGLAQPLWDGLKLFMKEDITPSAIDRKIYFIAPAIALFPAFALGATIPWGPSEGLYGILTPIANVDIGVLYILAISSLGAYGVVLAGYASNNKYSLMGALRASAQLISYELSMAMAVACVALAAGSMKLQNIVAAQEEMWLGFVPGVQNWYILTPFGFIAGIIFLIAMVAETNRAPFDLPEAENELIAGYHTEYSSMKFAVFFMGEYAAMFVLSGVFACLFLGGYNILPVDWGYLAASTGSGFFGFMDKANYWLAPLTFIGKCYGGMAFFIWCRATLPRLRYDQLMSLGWKTMLPASVATFILVGVWIVFSEPELAGTLGGWAVFILAAGIGVVVYLNILSAARKSGNLPESRTVTMVNPSRPERSVVTVDPNKV